MRRSLAAFSCVPVVLAFAALRPPCRHWPPEEPAGRDRLPGRPRSTLVIPPGAEAGPDFDIEKATQAYIETLPADKRARSDAYFEGGYWLELWGFLYGARHRLDFPRPPALGAHPRQGRERSPAGLSSRAGSTPSPTFRWRRRWPSRWRSTQDFYREHQYGMATQTFGEWFGERRATTDGGSACSSAPPAIAVLYAGFPQGRPQLVGLGRPHRAS